MPLLPLWAVRPVQSLSACTRVQFTFFVEVNLGRVAQSVLLLATGWTVRGSNPGGDEIFCPSRPTLWPTRPPVQWVPGLSLGVKSGRGVTLNPYPPLVQWSRKSRAMPLLPLWAVRPVQSVSACTRVHFTSYKDSGYRRISEVIDFVFTE